MYSILARGKKKLFRTILREIRTLYYSLRGVQLHNIIILTEIIIAT